MKVRKAFKFLFLILASLCFFIEIFQRINVYYRYRLQVEKFNDPLLELVSPLDKREYVLKKNVRFVANDGIVYEINKKGLRGKEYTYEKPKDVYRILMLGDSYLFGWGLQWEETLTVKLENLLNNNLIEKSKTYEVINAGIHGYNTIQELEFLKKEGYKYNPDMVILYFVMNDMEPQWNTPRHPRYEYEHCLSWFFDLLVQRINDYMVKITKNQNLRFSVCRSRHSTLYLRALDRETYKWNSCRRAILDFAKVLRERKINFYIFIAPDFSKDFKKYPFYRIHFKIGSLCSDNNIGVVDLLDLFATEQSEGFQINKYDRHPNAKANYIIAKKIYSYLINQGQKNLKD